MLLDVSYDSIRNSKSNTKGEDRTDRLRSSVLGTAFLPATQRNKDEKWGKT